MVKNIVHEKFLECQKYTLDVYWKEIILSCACNKFPRGAKYDSMKNVIYVRFDYRGKPKSEVHEVPEDSYEKYELLMHIFKDLLCLRSEYDIKLSKEELEEIRKMSEIDLNCEWKKLKPRSMRNQILMNFAISQVVEKGLDTKFTKHLYNTIQLGFQFKKLSNDDVKYEKGIIKSIDGLEFDEKKSIFILTHPQKSLARSNKPTSNRNRLNQTVDKWIRSYKTHYLLNL